METLAEELRAHGIDVNAVAPGALKTRLVEQVLAAGPEKVGSAFYAKNQQWATEGATPLELGARLCAWLASAESDGITGKLISAQWDPWARLSDHRAELAGSDIYCLRRIVPEDRGMKWS
jgi:3-oxoacyl-[acyl-carrier protein] reductase